jgi:arsenate reductase
MCSMPSTRDRVLFVCTGNRARSQMAEGLLRHLAGDRFEAYSAGTQPSGLASATVEVMQEIGIDVSGHRSKHVDEFVGEEFDYVITVCDHAAQVCPTFPGASRRIHWSVRDPFDRQGFRDARDDLRARIERFLADNSGERENFPSFSVYNSDEVG